MSVRISFDLSEKVEAALASVAAADKTLLMEAMCNCVEGCLQACLDDLCHVELRKPNCNIERARSFAMASRILELDKNSASA